ncbi:hypothetical protein TGMAS_229750B, partial [Toxoplasma gondii MAS]
SLFLSSAVTGASASDSAREEAAVPSQSSERGIADFSAASLFPLLLVFRYNANLEVTLLHAPLPPKALPHPTVPYLQHLFPGNFADLGEMPGDLDPTQGWLFNWVASMACLPPPPSCCASAQVNIKEFVSAIRRRVYARVWALQLLHHYCRHPERPPPLQALHSLLLLLPSPGAALGSCVLFMPVSALEVPAFSAGPAEVASLFGDEDKGDRDSASPRLFCGPASNSEAPAAGRKKGEDDVEKDIWKRMREAFLEDEDALAFKAIFEAHGRRVYALIKVFLNDRPANFRLFENVAPAPASPPDAREGDEGQNAKEDLEEETPKEERSAEVDEGPSRLSLEVRNKA